MIFFIVAAIVFGLDQWTKKLVMDHMFIGQSIPIIDDVIYLTSHRNKGAAFGILQDQRLFFIFVTVIVVVALVYYLYKYRATKSMLTIGLTLILGGALGNFIDRLRLGEVVDFIDVKISIGSFYHDFAIFNVADSALVIGVILVFIDTIRESIKGKKNNNETEESSV